MFAHRAGTFGAIVAVVVLSLELAGAMAWQHHVRSTAQGPVAAAPVAPVVVPEREALDSTLEQVTVDRPLTGR